MDFFLFQKKGQIENEIHNLLLSAPPDLKIQQKYDASFLEVKNRFGSGNNLTNILHCFGLKKWRLICNPNFAFDSFPKRIAEDQHKNMPWTDTYRGKEHRYA